MTSSGSDRGTTGVLEPPQRSRGSGSPPTGGGGSGDGGGDGWKGEPDPLPEDQPQDEHHGAGEFALRLAMVAISALFLVFLALLWNTRRQAPSWPPPGAPPPPMALWVSTVFLAASSMSLTRASLIAGRRGGTGRSWLVTTLLLGLGFLAGQVWAISVWISAGVEPADGGYGALFYLLLGAHGAHVIVGLIDLARLSLRAKPNPARIRLSGTYWHFMGVLWACVFALLWWPESS